MKSSCFGRDAGEVGDGLAPDNWEVISPTWSLSESADLPSGSSLSWKPLGLNALIYWRRYCSQSGTAVAKEHFQSFIKKGMAGLFSCLFSPEPDLPCGPAADARMGSLLLLFSYRCIGLFVIHGLWHAPKASLSSLGFAQVHVH